MAIPLQGAGFELRDSSGTVLRSGISDVNGLVDLGNVSPGVYTLVETIVPGGFLRNEPYTVVVAANGDITVNGIPLASFLAENYPYPNISFSKTDSADDALAGAVFSLDDGAGTVLYSTSTIDGIVVFYSIPPGVYTITETQAPFGYITNPTPRTAVVSATGEITIDGNPVSTFTAVNQDGPAMSFIKLDNTGQSLAPVINPVRNGLIPVTGTGVAGSSITVTWPDSSTTDVIVDYTNTWSATPATPLTVGQTVSAIQTTPGMLPSDPAAEIVQQASDIPVIDEVLEGDTTVTGTGVAGSTVAVTWPDGATTDTTVAGDNTWTITPPAALVFGEEISAVQTTTGMLPSLPADTTVQAISPIPVINQIVEDDTQIGGTGIPGSQITITWPDDTSNTTVGVFGTWVFTPPGGFGFTAGEIVTATQTVPGKLESPEATSTVLARSASPTIDTIMDGDTNISGTGVNGSTNTVTWPDGTTGTSIVQVGGTWSDTAPGALLFGEIVSATQTTPGMAESHPTETTVTAVSQTPAFARMRYTDTAINGTGVSGSLLTVTWTDGTTGSTTVLPNSQWSLTVPSAAAFVPWDYLHATQLTPGMLISAEAEGQILGPEN